MDAVIKAINMAIKWKLDFVSIMTYSATVHGWINSVLANSKRPKVSGLSEMIVKRRLNLVNELITEYRLQVQIQMVRSNKNKADELTRDPRE